MKKIALAAVLAATASTAFAGGMSMPVPEASPVMIEPAPAGSTAAAYIIPAILVALIAAASSDSDESTDTTGEED